MDKNFPVSAHRLQIPTWLLLLCIVLSLLIPGHSAPKPNLVNKQLNDSITLKTIIPVLQLVSDYDSSTKFIPVQLFNESDAPKEYILDRKQLVDSDNDTLKLNIPFPIQFYSSDNNNNASRNPVRKRLNDSDTTPKHPPIRRQFDDSDDDGEHIPVQRHSYYSDSDIFNGHIHVRRQTDDEDQEESGDAGNDDNSETNGDDSASKRENLKSHSDDSGTDNDDLESDGDNSDSYEGDSVDEDADDSDDSRTKKRGKDWPIQTWTEVMFLFRKDVRPEHLRMKVGRKNVFRFISKALERSRQTELEILKLKELLKKLRNRIRDEDEDDGDDGGHEVNININAASPLGISTETKNRKNAAKRGCCVRDVLHANYARSPFVAQASESDPSFGSDKGIKSSDLEEEKLKFIKKGAQFLRNAWYQYRMRKRHQLMERSEEGKTHKTEESIRNKENDVLKSEKHEYITKGVAFLQNAWNQYKLRKYHHL